MLICIPTVCLVDIRHIKAPNKQSRLYAYKSMHTSGARLQNTMTSEKYPRTITTLVKSTRNLPLWARKAGAEMAMLPAARICKMNLEGAQALHGIENGVGGSSLHRGAKRIPPLRSQSRARCKAIVSRSRSKKIDVARKRNGNSVAVRNPNGLLRSTNLPPSPKPRTRAAALRKGAGELRVGTRNVND